ncbi:hypothetical protein MTF65_16760 [Streptomyces sp. APSN-46.1]|uniref:hypothetical protein n=1 Tax=Streptomyces sp. APSN-46.1 TaxID=2929049 RepID=UPI001FB34B6B|nr:hypothetical protein [Streptomyces sp. APSN-46.1]MCJ1678958.1 hypothetical protein [Streptomyces sp. APSN-46.1]
MRTTRTRRTGAAAAAAALGLAALTGFTPAGDDDPFPGQSGEQVAEKSLAATRAATSLTMKGTAQAKGTSVWMDIQVSRSGDCKGTATVKGQGSFELIRNAKDVFLKADEGFTRAQLKHVPKEQADATVDLMADRWVKFSGTDPLFKELTPLCDLDELLGGSGQAEGAKKGKVVEEGGQEALTVSVPYEDGTQEFYVATHGTPYILRLVQTGEESGDFSYSGFNKPVDAKAPPGDVLDFGSL